MSDAPATILVVDDDQGLLRLVQKSLRREGFQTATASSGSEAIAWLTEKSADLMLLDLKLHDMDGNELIARLATLECSLPFVIITGQGDERVAVDMMKRGALDYLVKDVQFIEFVPTVVRRALAQLEKDKRLLEAQSALKQSQEQLLTISERERQQFGAELHDNLGQQLAAIELRCEAIKEDLPTNQPELKARLSEVCQYLREAISQTRSLAHGLSPVNLGSGGLTEALGELVARMTKEKRLKCTFDASPDLVVQDGRVAGHLFRIAQEAVNNALKHSGATQVSVWLTDRDSTLRLEIRDNGRGLRERSGANSGIGTQIMKYRASVIGADLKIESKKDRGVTVTCALKA